MRQVTTTAAWVQDAVGSGEVTFQLRGFLRLRAGRPSNLRVNSPQPTEN